MKENTTGIWNAGIPTEPDVVAMLARFPALNHGDLVTHEEIELTLDTPRQKERYKTVLAAWRKRLEQEQNLLLGSVRGVGYKVLDDSERVDAGASKLATAGRATTRSATILSGTNRALLSREQLTKAQHVNMAAVAVLGAIRLQAKQLNVALKEVAKLTEGTP